MLTAQQEKEIRLKILNSGISYFEVYQELCDHYLNAIESSMQSGSSFEQALVSTHADFGKEEGLKKLQKSFASSAIKYYRHLHWNEFWQRLKWPHILYVVLAALLGYALADFLSAQTIIVSLFLLSMVPFFAVGFTDRRIKDALWENHVFMPKTLRAVALRQQAIIVMSLFNIVFLGSRVIFGDEVTATLFNQLHQAALTGLIVFVFVWTWSFFLTVRNTTPKFT